MTLTVITSTGTSSGDLTPDQHTLSFTIPSLAVGDVVGVLAMTWDQPNTLNVPSGSGLSFTQRATVNATDYDRMYGWTAVASSGGTNVVVTCTVNAASNSIHNGVLYHCPTADGYSLGATPNTVASSAAATGSLSGSSGNLGIVAVGDWDGLTGAVTWASSGTGDQTCQQFNANAQYFGHVTLTGATTTVGITAPTTGRPAIVAIEILKSAGGGSNDGTLSATLPKVTGSLAGTATNPGTASANLPKTTGSISGTATNPGTTSATLPVVTGTIAGQSTNPGTTAGTLPAVTGSLTGTATNSGTIAGTLPKVTGTLADTSVVTGTIAATLPVVTGTVTGTATNSGTITATLPPTTGSTTGQAINAGTLTATLPKVIGTIADGGTVVTGTLSATLPKVTAVILGTSTNPAVVAGTLPTLRGSLAGTATNTGTLVGVLPRVAAGPPAVELATSSPSVSARSTGSSTVTGRAGPSSAVSPTT